MSNPRRDQSMFYWARDIVGMILAASMVVIGLRYLFGG